MPTVIVLAVLTWIIVSQRDAGWSVVLGHRFVPLPAVVLAPTRAGRWT